MIRKKFSLYMLGATVASILAAMASEQADPRSTESVDGLEEKVAKVTLHPNYDLASTGALCATQAGLYLQALDLVRKLPPLDQWVTSSMDQKKICLDDKSAGTTSEITLGELKVRALKLPLEAHNVGQLLRAYQQGHCAIPDKQLEVFDEYRSLNKIAQKLMATDIYRTAVMHDNFQDPTTWASHILDAQKLKPVDPKSSTLGDLKRHAIALSPAAPDALLRAYLNGDFGLDLQNPDIYEEFNDLWHMFQGVVNDAELIRILPKFLGKVPKEKALGAQDTRAIARDIAMYLKDPQLDERYGLSRRLMSSPWCYIVDIYRKEQGPEFSGMFTQRLPKSVLEAVFQEAIKRVKSTSSDPKDLNTWPNAYVYMLQDPGKLWSAPYQSNTDPNVAEGTLTLADLMERVKNDDVASFQTLLTAYEKGYFGMPAGSTEAQREATWWHGMTCMTDLFTGDENYLLAYAHSLCEKRFGCVTSNDCSIEYNALQCFLQQKNTTDLQAQPALAILNFPYLKSVFMQRAKYLQEMANKLPAESLD